MKVKKLSEDAILPRRATGESAGYDLYSAMHCAIMPGSRMLVKTDIAIQLEIGQVGLVCSRSELAMKHGVAVLNAPGIIDSDYRGNIGVLLINLGGETLQINKGDRIAQLVITDHHRLSIIHMDELETSYRDEFGFVHTVVKS